MPAVDLARPLEAAMPKPALAAAIALIAGVASVSCLPVAAAGADDAHVVLRYVGNRFDYTQDMQAWPAKEDSHVEAELWLRQALPADSLLSFHPLMADSALAAFGIWRVIDQRTGFAVGARVPARAYDLGIWFDVQLLTGPDGEIAAWWIRAQARNPYWYSWEGLVTEWNGGGGYDAYQSDSGTRQWSVGGQPGTWSTSVLNGPVPIPGVPEPGAGVLFGLGLLGAAWRARRVAAGTASAAPAGRAGG
ncbi:MAG: PEP-CTERM sorting domain-containing protein [Comamonadaceae bacterium]|nr:PEP-CTERM sorting domain-containing protein [Comamonadaceae bacterium]